MGTCRWRRALRVVGRRRAVGEEEYDNVTYNMMKL